MKNKHLQELKSPRILQIGYGSLGFHFYEHISALSASNVNLLKAQKDCEDGLETALKNFDFDYVFVATKDSVLESLINKVKSLSPRSKIIHFSGFHYFKEAVGVHPVASFSKNGTFDFSNIDFVIDGDFDNFLNQVFENTIQILPEHKNAYHTYLSVVANSIQLLSNQIGNDFEKETHLDSSVLKKIVIQSLKREVKHGKESFSGPWVRGEKKIQDQIVEKLKSKNLQNLNNTFKKAIEIYKEGGAL